MNSPKKQILLLLAISIFEFHLSPLLAQIDVEGKAKDKTIERADQRTGDGIDKGLDAVEDGVKSLFKKKPKKEAKTESEESQTQSNEPKQEEQVTKEVAKPQQPALQTATQYDFIPGDQILYYDDFETDEVGDFPALWTGNGTGEIQTTNLFPGKWFHLLQEDMVAVLQKDLVLPENFIFELDFIPLFGEKKNDDYGVGFGGFTWCFYEGTGEFLDNGLYPGTNGVHVGFDYNGWAVRGYKESAQYVQDGSGNAVIPSPGVVNHVIVWVQKSRLRIYFGGKKVVDLPSVIYYPDTKFNRLRFSLNGQSGAPLIKNIKFTTAAPDLRSKLLTDGKIICYGITFDVGKDVVKAESYGSLNGIAKVLKENPSVRIKIVGHTDSDGNAASNLDLSKRRSEAIRQSLNKNFGIETSRMEIEGKGANAPIVPNTSSENKAKNRRVEFIKL